MMTRMRGWAALAAGLWFLVLTAGTVRAEETYTFGVPPWQRGQSADDIRRLYRPMLDYLSRVIGARITLIGAGTYEDMVDYLAQGKVHFGTISPTPYVLAKAKNPAIDLLVTELGWNADRTATSDRYQGLIVTLKSNAAIDRIADLKGRQFAFVSPESTSGYIFPNAVLRRNGIDPAKDFAGTVFLGSHPRVTDALVTGSIDAGATWSFNYTQAVAKHGDIFKILDSVDIPNLCIAAHPSLPAEVRAKLKAALLAIDPKLLEGLPTAGYVERLDSFYDGVRRLNRFP